MAHSPPVAGHKPSRSIAIPCAEEQGDYADVSSSLPLSPADSENRMLHSILNEVANDTTKGGHKLSALRAIVNPKRKRPSESKVRARFVTLGQLRTCDCPRPPIGQPFGNHWPALGQTFANATPMFRPDTSHIVPWAALRIQHREAEATSCNEHWLFVRCTWFVKSAAQTIYKCSCSKLLSFSFFAFALIHLLYCSSSAASCASTL